MCGIAGILYRDKAAKVDSTVLREMADSVRHRGPDGVGFHVDGGLGLAHRRLAIIDPVAGQQPMVDPDTGNVIVYNGEVYNYVEIRSELRTLGYTFRTDSDTEVILKAYDKWGEEFLGRLNGMWAFALWDPRRRVLLLARDRLGIKPLHYCVDGDRLVFGSEIKSLFAAGVRRDPDRSLLDVYLTLGYIPAPHSFFSGIQKLLPGHYIAADGNRLQIRKYWNLPVVDEAEMRTDEGAVHEEFASLLRDAVRISMRSDVPFGAFLSGGLDSASVVTLMAEQTPLPVETYTIGFAEAGYDERDLARQVATQVGAHHHEYVVTPEDLNVALERVCVHYDEPFGDSSAIPTSHVARLAAQQVKMVLTGDGGDELLSGYPAYQVEKIAGHYQRIPNAMRAVAQSIVAGGASVTRGRTRYALNRYRRLIETTGYSFQQRLLSKGWLERERRDALLQDTRVYRVEDLVADLLKDCPYHDPFYQLMYFNLTVSLPDDMLTKVDRMTMAWSLEARVPFLDYRLVELMSRVHKSVKLPGLTRKAVLRQTVAKRLPPALLSASKRGFVVPLRAWFRNSDFAGQLATAPKVDWGLSPPVLNEILQEQQSGQKDYGNLIWMLLVLKRVLNS